jgi:hypothetical protein
VTVVQRAVAVVEVVVVEIEVEVQVGVEMEMEMEVLPWAASSLALLLALLLARVGSQRQARGCSCGKASPTERSLSMSGAVSLQAKGQPARGGRAMHGAAALVQDGCREW